MTSFLEKTAPSKFTTFTSIIALLVFIPLLIAVVYKTTQLVSKASGTKANIVIDTQTKLEEINTIFSCIAKAEKKPRHDAPILSETKGCPQNNQAGSYFMTTTMLFPKRAARFPLIFQTYTAVNTILAAAQNRFYPYPSCRLPSHKTA
jgi:hypothetical protein